MLTNLVSNALKYSPGGGEVCVHVAAGAARHVEITVRDQGIGIATADAARLFRPLVRGRGAGKRAGLGFSITEEIVKAHGGVIRDVSAPGDGGAVTVELPLA